jgi:hypothetical protein
VERLYFCPRCVCQNRFCAMGSQRRHATGGPALSAGAVRSSVPRSPRPQRRRLSLPVSHYRQPTSATAARKAPNHHRGHPLAGLGPAVSTRPMARRTRPTCSRGYGGQCVCIGVMQVGHGPRDAPHTVRPKLASPGSPHAAGFSRAAAETLPRCGGCFPSPTYPCSAQGMWLTLRFPEHFQVCDVLRSACRTFVGNELCPANVVHRNIPVAPSRPACPRLLP